MYTVALAVGSARPKHKETWAGMTARGTPLFVSGISAAAVVRRIRLYLDNHLTFLVAESNRGGNLNKASTTDTSNGLGGLARAAGAEHALQ